MISQTEFKRAVRSLGGIWNTDRIYFAKTPYIVYYMPSYPLEQPGDAIITIVPGKDVLVLYVRNQYLGWEEKNFAEAEHIGL